MVPLFHYTPVNAKQFEGLNIDGLARNRQKRQNFSPANFALYGNSSSFGLVLALLRSITSIVAIHIMLP